MAGSIIRWSRVVLLVVLLIGLVGFSYMQREDAEQTQREVEALTAENDDLRAQLAAIEDSTRELQEGMAVVARAVGADSASARSVGDQVDAVEADLADLRATLFGMFGQRTFDTDVIGDLESEVADLSSRLAATDRCVESIQTWMNSTYGSYLYC